MIQAREKACLALESLPSLLTLQEIFPDDLHGDVAIQARVPRAVDLPHPARAERREDLVGTETGAGVEHVRGECKSPAFPRV